jgi:hypothetical protein
MTARRLRALLAALEIAASLSTGTNPIGERFPRWLWQVPVLPGFAPQAAPVQGFYEMVEMFVLACSIFLRSPGFKSRDSGLPDRLAYKQPNYQDSKRGAILFWYTASQVYSFRTFILIW